MAVQFWNEKFPKRDVHGDWGPTTNLNVPVFLQIPAVRVVLLEINALDMLSLKRPVRISISWENAS